MHSHHTETLNKAIVRRMFDEMWNEGNLDVVDELFDPNYAGHDPTDPNPETREVHSSADAKQWVGMVRAAVPDIHFTVDDLIAEGDKVIARWTAEGTHTGELMGIPATGRRGRVSGILIYRIVDGKIKEGWQNWNTIGLLQQLGILPSPLDLREDQK
ncbi:MAG: ester cyclase [Chloroflexota bacterium]|nr:ester cyclase [Chloroflexota bacterium]